MTHFWAQEVPPVETPALTRSQRLHQLARCVELLGEELDALELGDLPRMRDIAEKRAHVETELRSGGDAATGSPFHLIFVEAVTEALRRVDEWTEQERLARDGLTQLRDGSFTLARSIPQTPAGGKYPVLEEMGGQLNVRL